MKTNAYYLLLGSLASAALAGCGEESEAGEECPHTVIVRSKSRPISRAAACQEVSLIPGVPAGGSYGIAWTRCAELCADPSMNECGLPTEYLLAFEAINGSPFSVSPDAGAVGNFQCPTGGDADLSLSCSQTESRGRLHEGCPVAGRRPQGLETAQYGKGSAVAEYLARAAHLEAASVLAFRALAADLARLGAPARLVADCLRAAREETSHARIVGQLARTRGVEPERVQLREGTAPSLLQLALDNITEGVVRECYGALQAIVSSQLAAAPDVRGAMAGIAVEEASHAALSARIAAWLDTRLLPAERQQVARARDAAIAALRREVDDEPLPALRTELGIPSRAVALRLVDALATHARTLRS